MTKKIQQTYQKLTHREHILKRPGMYIGNINTEKNRLFIVEDVNKIDDIRIIQKEVDYNPGFHKLIDEILVNASDHSIRTGLVKKIKINIEKDNISVENDGPGIPIVIHNIEKVYIPEMIFGHLLTSENYDDTEERVVGGLNGLGGKCTNIYSKKFIVETADGTNKYIQEFSDNLLKIGKPKISKNSKNYTKITFYPDFEKFGLTEITEEMQQIILKRCCDIAVYCPKVKVYYNDKMIPVKSFRDYMKMHTPDAVEFFHEKINDCWEIGITKSIDDNFQQSSLTNGINTFIGGTHVNFITSLITKYILDFLQKKYKNLKITPNDIRRKLFIFIICKIVNPTFDNQTKENLTTKMTAQITKDVVISDKLIKQLISSQMVEEIVKFIELKEKASLSSVSGKKTYKVRIRKLDDANKAGTSESEKCMLFLTEGDSASSFCISGFGEVGRDHFGVFPLKGKPLNVRDLPISRIKENEEIKNIIEALGLEFGKEYTSTKDLRYGKVVFMTDADCVDENTLIVTKRGNIPIKDISHDDEVLTHTGKYQFVKNIIKTTKNKYVQITINGEKINLGEYHKMIVVRDGEINEIFAKDILITDKFLVKKNHI